MPVLIRAARFDQWLRRLRDPEARTRILVRLRRLSLGNPGDIRPVGNGISELRIPYGPGYRVYLVAADQDRWILLTGGSKRTQVRDIENARRLAGEWEEEHG